MSEDGFRVGGVVVCVDDTGAPQLRLNAYYTVAEVLDSPGSGIGINVMGVEAGMPYLAFRAERFKPIKSDPIEQFRQIALDVSDGFKVDYGKDNPLDRRVKKPAKAAP